MNIQQFFRIFRARWLLMLITLLLTVSATIAVSLILPPRYTATASVVVDYKGIDPISGMILPTMPVTSYLATQVDIINSHGVARRAVDLLKLADNPSARELYIQETGGKGDIRDWLADLLLKYLEVTPSRESSVINISYTGNDPRFSAAVANAFVQAYINTNLDMKIVPARQTTHFFNEQIKQLKDNLERAQTRLSEYQRQKGIIATDERLDVENARLNDLSTQLVAAQGQTYDALSRQRQVQDILARGEVPRAIPDVISNPVIQGLKANLTQLEARMSDLSSKVGKNHPAYQALVSEIEGVKEALLAEIRTIGASLSSAASLAQKREDQIRSALAEQRAKILRMKAVRDDQNVLVREVENAQRAYDAAMARMTQTNLESQTTQTNVMVVTEAIEPIEPSSPRIVLNTILSVVIGSMLAIGFALLREMSDRIVRSESDLAESLGIPVLGVLGPGPRRIGRRGPLPALQAARST